MFTDSAQRWYGVGQHPIQIQETIEARIVNGRPLHYSENRIRITGTLHVGVEFDDGFLVNIYMLAVDRVELAVRRRDQRR